MLVELIFIAGGLLIIGAAWVPLFIRGLPLSLPMVAVGAGALLGLTASDGTILRGIPPESVELILRLALLSALISAGLKIDRAFSFANWTSVWRLLGLVMPISILLIAALAMALMGLDWRQALLLAAILSPTDPVLASSVQSGPPGVGEEGETRFALTAESGLNDGLAAPFVTLAFLPLAMDVPADIGHWAMTDGVWNIGAGVVAGMALGILLVVVNRQLPGDYRLSGSNSGMVSVGLAILTYGVAEPIGANGFVAAFVLAVTLRNSGRSVEYSRRLNHAAEQIERVITVIVLTGFGMAIITSGFDALRWSDAVLVILILLVVRPIAVVLGFLGSPFKPRTRIALAFFGIRGLGSLYYIVHAANLGAGLVDRHLIEVVSLVVLCSILLYGVSGDYATRRLDRHSGGTSGDRKAKYRREAGAPSEHET